MAGTSGRHVHAWVLGAAVMLAGCAHPAPPPGPVPQTSLQPVPGDGWQTFQAVLTDTYTDPAAGYDGVYPVKKSRVKFRIEVRVPRYAGTDTVGPTLMQHVPEQPPAKAPYVVVRIYTGSARLPVTPARIVPRAPCGPPGTPPSAVSVAVHTDADGMRSQPVAAATSSQPTATARAALQVAYTRIYVRFDTDPKTLASCTLVFTAAIGNGKVAIPPLRLVSDTARQYSPSVDETPGAE